MSSIPKKIDDLRSALLQAGKDESIVAKASKKELEAMYNELSFNISFEKNDEVEAVAATTKSSALPEYGSDDWQEYVLSLLKPSEQLDGHPRCFGLRRIAQLLLGPIVSAKASTVNVIPNGESRAVTINYEITFDWTLDRSIFVGSNTTGGLYRTFGGVADCVEDIKTPYGKHPAASAETKAMSRALKQALCINVLSAEEKVSGYDEKEDGGKLSSNKISEAQVNFITAKAKALGIEPANLLVTAGFDVKNLSDLTVEDGKKIFTVINTMQQRK